MKCRRCQRETRSQGDPGELPITRGSRHRDNCGHTEGTGLGLAPSRKFIELHGGRFEVKSEAGAGSTFTFAIPMRQEG